MSIYYIGGSPCSGKSTVAEILAQRHGIHYFKVDDHLDRYIEAAAAKGCESCARAHGMTPEQIWMRDPELQCAEELAIYAEIFEFVLADLQALGERDIITEGAAFLPSLMKGAGVLETRYISITPTEQFQISNYSRREWVPYVLEGCTDKEQAFANWMRRDVLFAEAVRRQCRELGYASIVQDGTIPPEEIAAAVERQFGLTTADV